MNRNVLELTFYNEYKYILNLQMESLVEFGTPVVAFRLGGEFSLLIREVGTDQVDFNEWTEHATGNHPLQIVGGNHCKDITHIKTINDISIIL